MDLTKFRLSQANSDFIGRIFSPPPFIGLDLGLEKLNLVQVDLKSGHPVIISASSDYHNADYEELMQQPELLQQLIKAAFKSGKFKGRKVVATVPGTLLKIIFLNFQCKPHENETQALLTALKNRLHDDLAQYVIDFLPINPQNTEQINRTALVAMAKQEAIENFLDLLTGCGLSVEALEIGPVAVKRLVSTMTGAADSQKVLTVNFGTQKTYLTVIWNNELLLDREIDFGMDNILNAIAKAFDVNINTALEVLHQYGLAENESVQFELDDDTENNSIKNVLIDILKPSFFVLTEEIKDVLVYVASETRGGAVELIYLMGSLARISAVDQILDRLISIPVKTINPFYGFSMQKNPASIDDLGPLSGIAVATGLSMRGKL